MPTTEIYTKIDLKQLSGLAEIWELWPHYKKFVNIFLKMLTDVVSEFIYFKVKSDRQVKT